MRISAGIVCLSLAAGVAADTITFNGIAHEDVLVYESDTFYYVVDPSLGEVQNVPIAEASGVTIVRDRSYRDELMEQYQNTRQAQAGGTSAIADAQAAATAMSQPGGAAPPGEAGPGGAGEAPRDGSTVITAPEEVGLGISVADLQAAVQGLGITLQGSGGTVSGTSSDGAVTVSATGSRSNLQSINVEVEVPTNEAATALAEQMGQLNAAFSDFAPWVLDWAGQQTIVIMEGGEESQIQDGIEATVQSSGMSGPELTVQLSVNYLG